MPPQIFSLAVIKGLSKGEVLRTDKKRIAVGRGPGNDLIVDDPQMANRHFMVLIDRDRWRIHTFSADSSITVDRRWVHPATGKRGAIVLASGSEILLFPGDLEQGIVDGEVQKRMTGGFLLPGPKEQLVTDVFDTPMEFDSEEVSSEPTIAVKMQKSAAEMDIVEMSQMPTIAGERPPDDIRAAARVKLLEERAPVAPSVRRELTPDPLANQPVHHPPTGDIFEEKTVGADWEDGAPTLSAKPKKKGSWDSARKPERKKEIPIPEVIAQPESQIMSLDRAGKSSMSARPSFGAPAEAKVIEMDPGRGSKPKKNAWGDSDEADSAETRMPVPVRKKNAWGDAKEKKNAWGDPAERPPDKGSRPRPDPRPDPAERPQQRALERPGPRAVAVGRLVSLPDLVAKSNDPALRILKEPDGALATSIRLLGTRVDEFARNLGYRAYMLTSPEPLTGKTTTLMNLAFALAEDTHRRVAVIEANFRFPRIFEILGTPEKEGIIPVLEGRASLTDSVVKVKDRNLVVLPTGGRHPHPAEILASPRFKSLLAELANTVDIALIDAPSTTPYADANLMLPLVDAAFLVVAHAQTRSAWISQSLQQIGEKRVLGAVYNQIPKAVNAQLAKWRKQRMKTD
jgi:Mrp family chromosome partitioning ATPase